MDIEHPKDAVDIVETRHGDLILDEAFAHRVYLKGILLQDAGSNTKNFKAAYNLLKGRVNRDRERMRHDDEEAKTIMHIWEEAIQIEGDRILSRYIDLLQDHENCVDIYNADSLISRNTAVAIWKKLKSEGTGKFYHSQKEDSQGIETIIKQLKQQRAPLSKKLWKILQRFSLVRIPHEQCVHLFRNSVTSEVPNNTFAVHIQHGLRASLALNPETEKIRVEFVTGANTELDTLFDKDQQLSKVHVKWLDFARTHEVKSCQLSKMRDEQLLDQFFN